MIKKEKFVGIKKRLEELEHQLLSPYAAFSDEARRDEPEPDPDYRTEFQRDRDRIVHSEAFRRLRSKTQVFILPLRDNVRTRLIHTLEVSAIARTICRALRLNEDLVEAIAMGHDLGHTPFGHQGEAAVREFVPGFHHAKQSLRVVEKLEKEGKGLNLTVEVRDGILKHTKGKGPIFLPPDHKFKPLTLEAQIVRISDALAYLASDVEDAIELGVMDPAEVPSHIWEVLGERYSVRLSTMITAVVQGSEGRDEIRMEERVGEVVQELKDFMYKNVYPREKEVRGDLDPAEIIRTLFDYFLKNIDQLREEYPYLADEEDVVVVKDHICGLGDNEAITIFRKITREKS